MTAGPATSTNRKLPYWRLKTGFDNVKTEEEIRRENFGPSQLEPALREGVRILSIARMLACVCHIPHRGECR